jgi:hypothetical protein
MQQPLIPCYKYLDRRLCSVCFSPPMRRSPARAWAFLQNAKTPRRATKCGSNHSTKPESRIPSDSLKTPLPMFHLLIKIVFLLTLIVSAAKLFLHMVPWLVALLALFGLLKLSQAIRK